MKTYIGDVPDIQLDIGRDVSAASALVIEALKPDGTTIVTWSAELLGTTEIRYVVPAGTLDQPGDWYLQAKVTIDGRTWYGESARLKVYERFK